MTTLAKLKNEGYDENKLKLDSAVYNTEFNVCVLNFVYNPNENFTQDDKKQVQKIIDEDLTPVCEVKTKFNKAYFDEDVIRGLIRKYFEEHYKALSLIFSDADIKISKEKLVKIVFCCDAMTRQVLENKGFNENIALYLSNKSFEKFDIHLEEKQIDLTPTQNMTYDDGLEKCLAEEELINKYEVELGELILGKPTEELGVILIRDLPTKNGERVLLAGSITNFHQSTFVRKSQKEESEAKELTKVSFVLKDLSGEIGVVWFPKPEEMELIAKLNELEQIAILATVSNFKENINLKLNCAWNCNILTKELKKVYRKVNENYHYVFPEPVTEVTQMDLFSLANGLSPYWETHDEVVVFDFETTGLSAKNCKIIEIGAVKVKKGSIIETFQTLVNPHEEVPEEITEITHITNEMVKEAPSIEQVLPDFYKFTYGAVLSAYNIDFDYQFLSLAGEQLRLLFNNEQIDTLKLARDKVPSLSNYKLGTVVKALDITLNNAHRALADAYATAKVFVKLI